MQMRDETESESEEFLVKQKETGPGKSPSSGKSSYDDEKTKGRYENNVCKNVDITKRHYQETIDLSPTHTKTEGELKNLGNQKLDPLDIITHSRNLNHDLSDKAVKMVLPIRSPVESHANHRSKPKINTKRARQKNTQPTAQY